MKMTHRRFVVPSLLTLTMTVICFSTTSRAQDAKPAAAPAMPQPIEFEQETLPNGLRVIYAPLHVAPVVHVRVLYHVGSKDERPDRQGFAHMFEHMMFRGSAHVKPEQHMRLIGTVGGDSNAFTSFDETVYVNTVPAEHLEMALYLEADRMASFKVDENIYKTERKVVAEEWRIRQNRPYGTMFEKFLASSFTKHSYRWTPIGVMEHLQAADVAELQDFFNTYYVPNNAILVVAGDIDVAKTREMAKKYFGWIPAGAEVKREIPKEPEQTQAKTVDMPDRVPLPAVLIGYHLPDFKNDDKYALGLLGDILSSGRSGRLDKELVYGPKPMAVNASAGPMTLEDAGVFTVDATVMQGRDPAAVEKALVDAVALVLEKGVTEEELEKAKTNERISLIRGRQTAVQLATQLGDEALYADDPARANQDLKKIQAVTVADVQAVAKKYLKPERATTLHVVPDPTGAATAKAVAEAAKAADAPVVAKREVKPRDVKFPEGYPTEPMLAKPKASATFKKGTESEVNGVKVIVMSDPRLPLVNWSLTTRRGSHSDPVGKDGLASIAGDMMRRGAGGMSFEQLNQALESRGINIEVGDGGDYTRLSGSSTTDQLEYAMQRTRDVLRLPDFPAEQFDKLKEQTVNQLALARDNPRTVAGMDFSRAIYGDSPLGRDATPETVSAITIDDVRNFYHTQVRPEDAILVIAGDVTEERGKELAKTLLDGWKVEGPAPKQPDYTLPPPPAKRKIILVDRPGGKQATIRMGIRAYDIHTDEKYAGSVASQILTAGIDSRLGKYVRAEKGLAYGVTGIFSPGRHSGAFVGSTDTAVESTGAAVEAMWKVFEDMRRENVLPKELAEAQMRVAGSMVMGMQTIQQQAAYRVDAILNGYPIDYYDVYPQKINQVTQDQIRDVMNKYVKDGQMVVVVVAPADAVKGQLEKLGDVEVVPMPAKREGAKEKDQELLKKKAA